MPYLSLCPPQGQNKSFNSRYHNVTAIAKPRRLASTRLNHSNPLNNNDSYQALSSTEMKFSITFKIVRYANVSIFKQNHNFFKRKSATTSTALSFKKTDKIPK